jgi:hypothetical protein
MNFLCHALPYLDQPLLAVATGVPDWLGVVDRQIRARQKLAIPYLDCDDPPLRQVAGGIVRHHQDDHWFHGTAAFVSTNLQLAVQLRELLPGDAGFRPTFVGHILIEMFLDALWIREDRRIADRYYEAVAAVSPAMIQRCVNQITGKPTARLAELIERFVEARFLYDYLSPPQLLFRLNQIMKRVRLPELPAGVADWLPAAEQLVESRRQPLLTPPDGSDPFGVLKS